MHKSLYAFFICGVIPQVYAGPDTGSNAPQSFVGSSEDNRSNFQRLSPRDLYYQLLQQSNNVDITEQKEAEKKQVETWQQEDRHHALQRIGPDPKPEDDQTLAPLPDPSPLHAPYAESDKDAEERQNQRDDKMDDLFKSKNLKGPPDEPKDDPNKPKSYPTSPLVKPDNQSNDTNNPLIQNDEQLKYLKDKTSPLKEDSERANPPEADPSHPLNDPIN